MRMCVVHGCGRPGAWSGMRRSGTRYQRMFCNVHERHWRYLRFVTVLRETDPYDESTL